MSLSNSPMRQGSFAAWIEEGAITHVDPKRRTVRWEATHSGRKFEDLQIYRQAAHNKFGEGCNNLPDVGAKCVVCQPSDDSAPFVLAYCVDPVNSENENGEIETSMKADTRKFPPGTFSYEGRKGNFYRLLPGGEMAIGSGPGNSLTFFPVSNLLHAVCKREKLDTYAGSVEWQVEDATTQSTQFSLRARETATDTLASVILKFGKITGAEQPPGTPSDQVLVQFAVSPQSITKDGQPTAQVISYVADKQGNAYHYSKGTVTTVIGQDATITINNNKTETITGNETRNIAGNVTETIIGNRDSTAMNQTIRALTAVNMEAPLCRFGGPAAAQPTVYGPLLLAWLATHIHPGPFLPAVTVPGLPALVAGRYLYL